MTAAGLWLKAFPQCAIAPRLSFIAKFTRRVMRRNRL